VEFRPERSCGGSLTSAKVPPCWGESLFLSPSSSLKLTFISHSQFVSTLGVLVVRWWLERSFGDLGGTHEYQVSVSVSVSLFLKSSLSVRFVFFISFKFTD